jgi:crotonobetainyl-CoA:carnitine CoA-transferase CaiB-like acyl-CoA transferase
VPPLGPSGESLAFVARNADKSSVEVAHGSAGDGVVSDLLGWADVVIVDLPREEFATRGLDVQFERRPKLVVIRITGFGTEGPMRDLPSDSLLAEAYGGLATMIGDADDRPLALGGEQAAYCAGVTGFLGAMLALSRRDAGHGGDVVNVELCDVVAYMDWKSDILLALTGTAPQRSGRNPGDWQLVRARDGWVGFIFQGKHWRSVVDLVGAPELADPALEDDVVRRRRAPQWWPVIENWASPRTAEEIYAKAQERGLPFGWINRPSDLVHSIQLRHRGFILLDPDMSGASPVVGSPIRSDGLPWRAGRAPGFGGSMGERPSSDESQLPATTSNTHPLAGVVVLDFGSITAGAAVTRLMADFGATVLKVEWLDNPDTFRSWKMPDDSTETSPYFASNNLGKLGVGVNLKTDEGRQIVRQLARHAHVVVENYRVGVTARLGIDADTLQQINPNLLYLSLSSQGQDGPEAVNSSYGSTLDLLSGLAAVTGYDGDRPLWSSSDVNYPDQLVSLFGAAFVSYCIYEGLSGARLDVSQREVVSWTLAAEIADFVINGHDAAADGNHRPGRVPHEIYPSRDADRWVALSCATDVERESLAACLGSPELVERDATWWFANEALVDSVVANWTVERSRSEIIDQLRGVGVPVVEVLDAVSRASQPRFGEHKVTVARGGYATKGLPLTFAHYEPSVAEEAPSLGAQTRQVLRQYCDLSDEAINDLEARGVIHCA